MMFINNLKNEHDLIMIENVVPLMIGGGKKANGYYGPVHIVCPIDQRKI